MEEDIRNIFGIDIDAKIGAHYLHYEEEIEKYLSPNMEFAELTKFYNDYEVVVEVDKVFEKASIKEDSMKILETINYLDESMLNPNQFEIIYKRDENDDRELFYFYDIKEIMTVEQIEAEMLDSIE